MVIVNLLCPQCAIIIDRENVPSVHLWERFDLKTLDKKTPILLLLLLPLVIITNNITQNNTTGVYLIIHKYNMKNKFLVFISVFHTWLAL